MQKYGKIKEHGEAFHVYKGFSGFWEAIGDGGSEPSSIWIHLLVRVLVCLSVEGCGEPVLGVCFLPP